MTHCAKPDLVGLWVDDSPRTATGNAWWERCASLGVGELIVMVDDAPRGFKPRWSLKDIEKFRRQRDIWLPNATLGIDWWADPIARELDKARLWFMDAIPILEAIELEADGEGNWKPSKVRGFRPTATELARGKTPIDLAGDYIVAEVFNVLRETFGIRRAWSTFTSHTENGRAADVVPELDVANVQMYPVRHRAKRTIAWTHTYGPERMPPHTLDRTVLIPEVASGKVEVVAGLAAWDQKWPGHSIADAMGTAVDAALGWRGPLRPRGRGRSRVTRVRYWSSKWPIGARRNSRYMAQIAAFIRSLSQ